MNTVWRAVGILKWSQQCALSRAHLHIQSKSLQHISAPTLRGSIEFIYHAYFYDKTVLRCGINIYAIYAGSFKALPLRPRTNLLTFNVLDSVRHQVVEDVIRPLLRLLVGDPGLFQQVDLHVGPGQLSRLVEVDADELAEARAVVVPHGLGVAKGLQDGVRLDDLVLERDLALQRLPGGAHAGKVPDDLLGVLRLACSGLSAFTRKNSRSFQFK